MGSFSSSAAHEVESHHSCRCYCACGCLVTSLLRDNGLGNTSSYTRVQRMHRVRCNPVHARCR